MTTTNLLQKFTANLRHFIPAAELEAMCIHLTMHLAEKYSLNPGAFLPEAAQTEMDKLTADLKIGMPFQYAMGYCWFYKHKFTVKPAVLIPRPETEELVDLTLKTLQNAGLPHNLTILDVGTGTGCIAISLALALPHSRVTGIDVSADALEVAAHNAAVLQAKVDFKAVDFLNTQETAQLGSFNVIVSNPPYVPDNEEEALEPQVKKWEPASALFVPDSDPLIFYNSLADFAENNLLPGGYVYMECHYLFAQHVKELFESRGFAAHLLQDMSGNDRLVWGCKR
ncbi:MAG: peptide chain release factor N(5)-glutamine methyltransferase [Chitinophagaceae bacterium]|nr:peptide chain release factor N(5)-glutamine methyltransferase [Chitinophagaceae bacterium]